jgi:prevent-host-death family protein
MTIASLAEVKAKFSAYVEACKTSPVVVTKNGKPAAVLVSVADNDDLESILLACSPRFQRLLERSNRQIDQGKSIPHDEIWKRVEDNESAA